MSGKSDLEVTDLEVLEDLTKSSKCDEGFLHVRRLRVQNRRSDGSASKPFQVDVIERPRLDAIAVLVFRKTHVGGIEFLTRTVIRPAAYFRKDRKPPIPDGRLHLQCEEIVAGVIEEADVGELGVRRRAAEEVREEGGFEVSASDVHLLGHPFFPAPGIVSEKIYVSTCDVSGRAQLVPSTDGSPLEEGGVLKWRSKEDLLQAISTGEIQDAKTEIAVRRFFSKSA